MQPQPTGSHTVQDFLNQIEQTLFFKDKLTDGSLEHHLKDYRRLPTQKRWCFHIAGGLVVGLSVALPVVAAFWNRLFGTPIGDLKDFIVASIAFLIAILSGLNTFYRWDAGWHGQINALLALQNLKAQWEVKKVEALMEPDPAKGLEIIQKAAENYIAEANSIIKAETQEYLTLQKFPDSKNAK